MIVPARVGPPIALLVALLTVTVVYDAGIADAPRDFFGERDDVVLLLPGSGSVTSTGTVHESLASVLLTRDDVQLVSPEVVVLTSLQGRSLVARGVDAPAFMEIERASLVEGRMPAGPFEALAGRELARILDIDVGETVLLVGSLKEQAARVRVVGVFDASSLARDELLVSVPAARGLAGISAEGVHLLRVKTNDTENVTRLASSIEPTFTYSDVRLSATDVFAGEPIVLRGNLTNWGIVAGTKEVRPTANGVVVGERIVSVGPRSTVSFEIPLELEGTGEFDVVVNPTLELRVREPPAHFVGLPEAIPLGEPTPIELWYEETPAAGASVVLGGAAVVTDEEGRATVVASTLGPQRLTATVGGERIAIRDVFVATRENLSRPAAAPIAIEVDRPLVGVGEVSSVNVTVLGVGGIAGHTTVSLVLDDATTIQVPVLVAPGGSVRQQVELGVLPPGRHGLRLEGLEVTETIEVFDGDPVLEGLLRAKEAARARPELTPRVGDDATEYVDRIVRNVTLAATAISLAAGLLVVLALLAVWSRHLAERAPSIGILKSIGAKREQAQAVVLRATLLYGGAGCVAGVVIGTVVAYAIDATGWVRAFGHRIPPETSVWLLFVLVTTTLAANAVVAVLLAGRIYDAPPSALLGQQAPRPLSEAPTLREALAEAAP